MRVRLAFGILLTLLCVTSPAPAAEPFKLGTFEHDGREFVGVVVRDRFVIDLAAANASLERRRPLWVKLPMPTDMKELIGWYDIGLRTRVHDIVDAVAGSLESAARPGYVHEVKDLYIFPPVRPTLLLATGLNYREHMNEMTSGKPAQMSDAKATDPKPQSMPYFWERKPGDTRQNPYIFVKPATIVIGNGEPILMKPKREQIDWECEFAVVIGQPASGVPIDEAERHVFGYTMMMDIGDREGRGDNRYGSDWLVWKGTETFAPLGPFIVPKEFVPNPNKLGIRLTVSGKIMQDANTELFLHSIPELIHFASNNLILRPGDVLSTGTPGGVGYARVPPIFLKPGDVTACSADGIGTLTNTVKRWLDVYPR